jgi:hypothetical protein
LDGSGLSPGGYLEDSASVTVGTAAWQPLHGGGMQVIE